MAETPFTGLTASVKVGEHASAVAVGYISGVDLNLENDIIEILAFGSQYKEKVPSIKNWSATANGTAAFATGGAQKTLYDAFNGATSVTLGIYLDDTTYFEGTAYIKSLKISAAPDDAITLEAEFEGSGAVTMTLPA